MTDTLSECPTPPSPNRSPSAAARLVRGRWMIAGNALLSLAALAISRGANGVAPLPWMAGYGVAWAEL